MQLHHGLTVGADPELFAVKDGKFVSAHDLLPGIKEAPHEVEGGAVQVDGVAAEFNINPAKTPEEFVESIRLVVNNMTRLAHEIDNTLEFVATPTATFDPDYFDSLPPPVKQLGCEPDYLAWLDGKVNNKAKPDVKFRTGGGHIHVGWTENKEKTDIQHFHDCVAMTKQLDVSLFIPSILWDPDTERRKLYGEMGTFRPKSYGVEYRPLSNAWVADPELAAWIFATVGTSFDYLDASYRMWEDAEFVGTIASAMTGSLKRGAAIDHIHRLQDYGFPDFPDKYI